jgi:Putative DNA-binding domain
MSAIAEIRSFEDASQFIAKQPRIWARVAGAFEREGNWTVEALELVGGSAPRAWLPKLWRYPSALLAALETTGDTVEAWLRQGAVTVDGVTLALPQLYGNASWERSASGAPTSFATMDWPVLETRLGQPVGRVSSQEPLISEGSPSFRNLYVGAASLFGIVRGPNESLHQGIAFRHQDTRGRLIGVRVGPGEVAVTVDGDDLAGMTVELAGDEPGPSRVVGASDRDVRFQLAQGLPPGAWVVLRRDSEWIDRRFLAGPWRRESEPGVEFVPLGTRLEVFLANREGPDIEFKELVPTARDNPKTVMKTVCAFANGEGGSILFGVDDDLNAIGLPAASTEGAKAQLTDLVYGWIQPTPALGFQMLPIEGSEAMVLELRVEPGSSLFSCGTPNQAPTIYVRHGAKTVPARGDEIERIVRARSPSPSRRFGF